MLRPSVARRRKVKRSASAPKAGMPSGNSFCVRSRILGASSGLRSPVVRFSSSASSAMPSIRSTGSSMLPSDFDIFLPSCVAHDAVDVDVAERHRPVKWVVIMIMRATQKKMMS